MAKMDYLKEMPIAVLGGGAVGKTCAADMKLAGREVRLFDMMPFAEKTLANLDKTGIDLDGIQRNLYGFKRSGNAKFDVITTDMAAAVKVQDTSSSLLPLSRTSISSVSLSRFLKTVRLSASSQITTRRCSFAK